MATFERIETVLRGLRRGGASAGNDYPLELNERNELLVAQGLPPYSEATRAGLRWKVSTATAFAAVVALPTTTAKLEIVNNTTNRSMIVDTIHVYQLLGTAVVWGVTPWAQVGAAVYSGNTALVMYSANGKASITSAASTEARTAIDQTVAAAGWEPFPGNGGSPLAAATPGQTVIGQVDGRLIVPPSKALHVTVTGSVNTASAFHCGASWYWAPVTNE